MSKKVTLQLCSGQRFDDITIRNLDQTLAEFLDVTLKELEGDCKLTLPETDNDLIDSREFKAYDEDKTDTLPLDLPIKTITYITNPITAQYSPVLILDSVIFRSATEVEIDERVTRARRGTSSSRKNRPPYPPTRSLSLGVKGMSKDHMIFLAGRKEYNGSLSNGSRWQPNSNQSDVTSLSDVNVSDDFLERYMNSSASVDESMSVQSYESGTSDMSEVTLRRSRLISSTSTPTKRSDYDVDSITGEGIGGGRGSIRGSPSGHQLVTNTQQSENHSNSVKEESPRHVAAPKLLLKQTTLAEDEEINLDTPTSTASFGEMVTIEARPPSTSSTEQNSVIEQPDTPSKPSSSPLESPKLNQRKVRLASRRNSNIPLLRPVSLHEGAVSPNSPLLRVSEYNRTIRSSSSTRNKGIVISPKHAEVFGKIKQFNVEFDVVTANLTVEMMIRGDYTVSQIKENLWQHLREQGHINQEFDYLWDPEKFTFTYQMNEEVYELYDGQQIFQTSTVAQLWRQEKIQEKGEKGKLMVEQKKTEIKEEKTLSMQISNMIGIGLYQLQFANNDELDITRRKMVSERRKAVKMRDKAMYSMEAEVHCSSLPPHIIEAIGEQKKLLLKVYYSAGAYQTFQVDMHTTADELLEMAIPKENHKRTRLGIPEDCDINEHVLKVAGRDSYIHGNYELQEFTHIIKFVGKHRDIELWMVKKLDVSLDLPRELPDWNFIDESTGLTGTHEELSALSKEHTEVFTMSMWDIQRKFRVRVLGIDNLRNCLPDYDVVYVAVGIFHGGEELCPIFSTNEVNAATYPRWNQWLVFDTSVKNLPKAARLCIAIYGGIRRSDNKRRGSTWGRKEKASSSTKPEVQVDRTLHWVNMQILDHRALLRQGVLRLNLWPNQSNSNDSQWGGMSPVGSTAINPDGNSAAVLYLELDTYMHPVACPTEGWSRSQSGHFDPFHKESSPFRADIDKSISSDPLAPLLPAEKELLWNFRSQLVTSPEALPKFLRCVNWADLDQVTETHKLLKQWMPVTMDVALQLLDYHYADEKVRSLAVKRLSKLTNDELLVYFLQLIQVLKFEAYHDSALARLLLGRALRSKRLGHYFFWYLRSEMDTPEFSQRFGILLESYLKGCGETMFKELQNQNNAIQNLMRIAAGLKKHMEKHKGSVTEYVREELKNNCKLPEYFAPPYESGLRMGNLRIDKCRVMDSKKTPLWLEFENLDTAQISKRPITVIAKHGDDLRQDMLTLQMLELMNGLWLAKGLDLYIIPYGCMATGDGMGIIEVVQDAETVAKIQLNHGGSGFAGSLSTLKDEPLHDWLKKKNPSPLQFEKAVDRFMHSCAGYCVATYVLGIGDRHNDNIMLTTYGNLFHIDFGHFLGNTKAFLGYNRERAPFVLTPDFEYVLGKRTSETFHKFEEIAVKAYLIIRQNANLFINLFSMMKCTGIPELRSVKDIEYLRDVLVLQQTEQQATEHFRQQIQKCLKHQWSTQLNWLAHNLAH